MSFVVFVCIMAYRFLSCGHTRHVGIEQGGSFAAVMILFHIGAGS